MRLSLLALHLLLLPLSANADVLHTNHFGEVFDGNSPFAVGKVNTSTAGRLRTDMFGDVYVEGSPFKVDAKEALNLKD